jgi:hypothetical protein
VPVLSDANFRNERVVQVALSAASQYDRVVGWTLKPFFASDGFNTIEYGIRKNSPAPEAPDTGAVLVVGSSFTAGSEVKDWETWPAQLEQLLHQRVLNAAVGGYSVDQIVLRAEQLIPLLRPRTLILEVMDLAIQWNGYSNRSRPKPYFTMQDGRLVAHNSPVPALASATDRLDRVKNMAGHFLLVDRLMSVAAADAWYTSPENIITRIQSDEVEVSCQLLEDLKGRADAGGVRMLLLTHIAGPEVVSDAPPNNLQLVEQCARAIGVQVAGTFPAFKTVHQRSSEEYARHFVMHGETFGHMSAIGHQLIAHVAAAALDSPPPAAVPPGTRVVESFVPGDGHNLIADSESLDTTFRGSVAEMQLVSTRTESPREFRLVARGAPGEHYVGASLTGLAAGPYTLSFDVYPTRTPAMRAQVLDSSSGGVIADINFARLTTSTIRHGQTQRLVADVKRAGGGWYRVSIGGRLAGEPTAILLQMTSSDGALNFAPGQETLTIRRLQLERGDSASSYQPTTTGRADETRRATAKQPSEVQASHADALIDGPLVRGDARNVIPTGDALHQWISATAHASFTRAAHAGGRPQAFEIAAIGQPGEHYVVTSPLALPRSAYTLAFDVLPTASSAVRIQIQDSSGANAVVADVDFTRLTAQTTRRGGARFRPAEVKKAGDGWLRVSVTGDLDADALQVILQLADKNGALSFRPDKQALTIRAVQLEAGETASPYQVK